MSGTTRFPLPPGHYNQAYESYRNVWIARGLQDRQQVLRFARVDAFREGYHALTAQNAAWAAIYGAASAPTTVNPVNGVQVSLLADTTSNQWDDLYRAFVAIDLTGLLRSSSVVVGARVVLRCLNSTTGTTPWASQFGGGVVLVAGPPSNSGTPADADFNDYGSTALGEANVTLSAGSTAQSVGFALNAAGIAHIKTTAPTMFGLRLSHDVSNTAPSWVSANEDKALFYNFASIRTPAFLDLLYHY